LDPGGKVDSEVFNAGDWNSALAKLAGQHRAAFDLLQQGLAAQDLCAVAEAATLSARTHQKILYNPLLEWAQALARETGAVGICRAHSGTVVGLLFHKASFDKRSIVPYLRKQLPVRIRLHSTELTGGGPRFSA
jgi:L-threonine kinase